MTKRVFIIHGWDGYPEEGWFPWLRKELSKEKFDVSIPLLPHPESPEINDWVACVRNLVGDVDAHTYFIGHSIGCQTILRYLESLPKEAKIGGAVFVAGWFSLTNLETDEEKDIARPWIGTPIDFVKVKHHIDKITAIFSNNDPLVPLEENLAIFQTRLGAKIIVEQDKGHFSGEDGITQLPNALTAISEMLKD